MSGGESKNRTPVLRIAEVVLDCNRPEIAAAFWEAALGYRQVWSGGQFRQLRDPFGGGMTILLQQVPEGKIVKNRVHIDLSAADMTAEVARLTALGARALRELNELGSHWTVMIDPEGNEFCVVAGSADSAG